MCITHSNREIKISKKSGSELWQLSHKATKVIKIIEKVRINEKENMVQGLKLGAFRCLSQFSLFSHSVMSNFLWPDESQHASPPCPSPTLGGHSDSHPSSQWSHPAISSSVIPFSSCPQSLPASESFPMSQHFAWGGQSTGVSALASFLPKKTQGWSPL